MCIIKYFLYPDEKDPKKLEEIFNYIKLNSNKNSGILDFIPDSW
jgi:hypothetical protein